MLGKCADKNRTVGERSPNKLPGIKLFGEDPIIDWYDHGYERGTDFWWVVYSTRQPISRQNRKQLKSLGWKLKRHERTNKEYWCIWEPK